MTTMTTKDLRQAVYSLLWTEALALSEYDAQRYELDVIDPCTYSKHTPEAARAASWAEWEARFLAEYDDECTEVSAFVNRKVAALAATYLSKAKVHLRWMAQRAPEGVRRELRSLVAAHQSSNAALLFAYLILKDIVEEQATNYESSDVTGEDRFKDVVDSLNGEYDGPENLGALVKAVTLPAPRRQAVPAAQYAAGTVKRQRAVHAA